MVTADCGQRLTNPDEAIRRLHTYGLAAVLTDEDDPSLWAAVLGTYWPLPDSPTIQIWEYRFEWKVSSLRFAVGRPEPDRPDRIKVIDQWCFERVDARSLRVKPFEDREVSFDHPWIGLAVTRPSRNQSHALVELWTLHHARAGHGRVYRWERSSTGDWTEAQIVTEWMV